MNKAPAGWVKRDVENYDPETALAAMHVTKRISFTAGAVAFDFDVKLPKRISDVLTEEDWQVCMADLISFAETIVHNARGLGQDPKESQWFMHRRLADRLNERFTDHQLAAGNQSWASPMALNDRSLIGRL